MPTRRDTNSAADTRSGGQRLDAKRCGCTGERRVLGRKRQTQPHGQLQVGRIVSCEAPLAGEWQYVSKCAPREVGVDADVEIAKNPQELDGARLGDAPTPLGAEQDVPELQRPKRRDVSGRGAQSIEKR